MNKIFTNPSPIFMNDITSATMINQEMNSPSHVGGGIITTTIITCGAKLGSATIKTVGGAITIVAV